MDDQRATGCSDFELLPERLRRACLASGYTSCELARALEVEPRTVESWMTYEEVPTLLQLQRCALLVDRTDKQLCFGATRVAPQGEPGLGRSSVLALLDAVGATDQQRAAWDAHANSCRALTFSRTYVLTFTVAWSAAAAAGAGAYDARVRARTVADRSHTLAQAVAVGARGIDRRLLPPLAIEGFSPAEVAEQHTKQLSKLIGLVPPIDASVLALALGHWLVADGSTPGEEDAEREGFEDLQWS